MGEVMPPLCAPFWRVTRCNSNRDKSDVEVGEVIRVNRTSRCSFNLDETQNQIPPLKTGHWLQGPNYSDYAKVRYVLEILGLSKVIISYIGR